MKTDLSKRVAYVFLFAILILSAFFFVNSARFYAKGEWHDPALSVGEEEIPPVQESAPSVLSLDKVSSPIAGRTSWANKDKGRPLGFVIYLNNDVSFTPDQINLQIRLNQDDLAKITFTRGEKSATPVLICAGVDGGYSSKSFFAFFFGGDLSDEVLNEYMEGDKVVIEQGCVLKCNEGSYIVDQKIEFIFDGTQWTTDIETAPEIIEYSAVGVPVDGVTNWGKDREYVGIVIYNESVMFEGGQSHLETKPWTKIEKVTFSRGAVTEECVLIAAGKDGTKNACYCSYFFGGELVGTTLQSGDTIKIKGDFAFTTKEGRYSYGTDLEFIFDGTQWTTDIEKAPEIIEYSAVGVPVDGVTNWGKDREYVGIVIYNESVTFEGGQSHLETKPWTKIEKITFSRGAVTEECVLIAAGKDGTKNACYCSYFFGGELVGTTLQSGDTVKIKGDFAFTTKEGRYSYGTDLEFIYDGTQWTTDIETAPEIIEYSAVGVPVDGVTNWGKDREYVGIVIYNESVTFEGGQSHLETKPWTKIEKITFSRGAVTEECVLIAAGKDGTKNACYCSYFFGGELVGTTLQSGDTIKIKGDFAFTTKEGRYSYGTDLEFIYDGTQWIDRASGDKDYTFITYIPEPIEDGDKIFFNLKTTTIFAANDVVTDDIKQSVLINGVSVKDLGDKADISYSASKIVLSVDKTALKLDDYDLIELKKGALLSGNESGGLRLRDDETFRYSHTLRRTDLIPDHDYYGNLSSFAIIDNIEIAGDVSLVNINGVKYDLAHSVWIHFKWAAKTNYDSFQMHLSAEQFVLTGILNEKLCYEYQKLGFFYSVTDLMKVNGKSIYEWMIIDAKNNESNGFKFKVEYLPYEIDSGRVLRIVVADESMLNIGIGVDQSIEFKQGFINPALGEIQKDSVYSIKAEDATSNNKFNMGFKQENKGTDKQSSGCAGCGGEICVEHFALFILACALSGLVLLKKWRKRG